MVSLIDVAVDDSRSRQRIALQQLLESFPVHLVATVAAVKPLTPYALDGSKESRQRSIVVRDSIIRVVSAYLAAQLRALFANRPVPVLPRTNVWPL